MSIAVVDTKILTQTGEILLLGATGYSVFQVLRGRWFFEDAIFRVFFAILCLSSFKEATDWLYGLSELLEGKFASYESETPLKSFLLESLAKSALQPAADPTAYSKMNVVALLEQALRIGVWGVMTDIIEGLFVLIRFALPLIQKVFWNILLVLSPIAIGLFPVRERLLVNTIGYFFELSLWLPMLSLLDLLLGAVTRSDVQKTGSFGVPIVIVEMVIGFVMLFVPRFCHKITSGALSEDFDSHSKLVNLAKTATFMAASGVRGKSK